MSSANCHSEIACYIARNDNAGRRAIVTDADGIIFNISIANGDFIDEIGCRRRLVNRIHFTFDGQHATSGKWHLANVHHPVSIGDLPHPNIDGLGLHSHYGETDYDGGI